MCCIANGSSATEAPLIPCPRYLPDGAMVAADGEAFLIANGRTWRWSFGGYAPSGVAASMRC